MELQPTLGNKIKTHCDTRLFGAMVWWLGLMALVDTASAESCLVQGMAYQSSRVGTLPNGAWVSDASTCQSNCAASPFCDYFTWYNAAWRSLF